jgi:3-keto-L-gulonate-6-phosphate decarboxylase
MTYSMPVGVPENGLFMFDFDRVKHELELLGYDCVEVHRGMDTELFDAGIAKIRALDEPPTEIIVARFDRRR